VTGGMVRQAFVEIFNEGFVASEIARTLRNTPPDLRPEAFESMRPARTVPEGCFEWGHHLIWLEGLLEIAPVRLTAVEAEGLLALKRERQRFQSEHPPCPKCGMPNERHALRCRECMGEIGRILRGMG
jgi:hypothetical protein